jgi:RimJ/RimL family protein N-acetyltransferase
LAEDRRQLTSIVTSRLVLEPVTRQLALDVVSGHFSDIPAGAGWPHADTADAMAMALAPDAGPSWVVTVDGVVIGDCGAFSWPDERGVVEIGYGLAERFRGEGYATEAAGGMCRWLFEAGARTITATAVEAANVASRRVLEKLAFVLVADDGRYVSYRLEHGPEGRR